MAAGVIASLLMVGYVVGLPPLGSPDVNRDNASSDVTASVAATGLQARRDGPAGPRRAHPTAPVKAPAALVPPAIAQPSLPLTPGLPTTRLPSGQDVAARTDQAPGEGHENSAPTSSWRQVLEAVDGRRQRAWHRGDPSALRMVFVAGSAELAADRQALLSYVRRGLHVDGVATSYRVVAVQRTAAATATLLVVDRLGQAVARDASGHHVVLPTDQPTRHRITLRRIGGVWRIASVQDA